MHDENFPVNRFSANGNFFFLVQKDDEKKNRQSIESSGSIRALRDVKCRINDARMRIPKT